MINTIFGQKIEQTQKFTQEGERIPLTRIKIGPIIVSQIKTIDCDGYNALKIAWGEKRKKGAKLNKAPLILAEIKSNEISKFKVGDKINPAEVIKEGDLVKITGISKGKGFTGVVKRWHFKGGPRTHGQSDRERAPGSIGQTTTPGRVYKGKKMAGWMGGIKVTIKGLKVIKIDTQSNILEIKGLVPGPKKGLLKITKDKERKNAENRSA